MWPAYAGLGVAGAGLIVTIVFAAFKADSQSKADAVASSIRDAAANTKPTPISSKGVCTSTDPSIQTRFNSACTTLKDNNDKVDTNATIANIGLGTFIVAGAFTAAWFIAVPIVNRNRERSGLGPIKVPTLRPYAGPGNGGLSLDGTF
jgi:hypothetical protein